MSPVSTSPILHEYSLMEELGVSPFSFEDQIVEFPSFKTIVKWIFGKKLNINLKKGLDAKKVDFWLSILDARRTERENKSKEFQDKINEGFK